MLQSYFFLSTYQHNSSFFLIFYQKKLPPHIARCTAELSKRDFSFNFHSSFFIFFCNFISTRNDTSRPRPTPKAMTIQK